MRASLCVLLYYTVFILGTYGRRLTRHRGGKLIDVTQLFAGVDHITFADAESATMCCCKKLSLDGYCKLVEWTKTKNRCCEVLSSAYHKHSNSKRPPNGRHCLVDPTESPEVVGMLKDGIADRLHHPKIAIASYHVHPQRTARASLRVYLMRHGQSKWNVLTEKGKGFREWMKHGLKDAQLTAKGVDQAISGQEFFRKTLAGVDPKSVQFAGSLLSRAYDTLVLATYYVWSIWNDAHYVIDQVPAFMEFGGEDTKRHSGLLDDSPVRWEESALPEHDVISEVFTEESFKKHYESDDFGSEGWLTDEPWTVQVNYQRHSTDSKCHHNNAQLDDAISYMKDVALSGKKHLVIGSHSNLIRCLMKRISKRSLFRGVEIGNKSVSAEWQDEEGGTYNVYKKRIHNAAVLTFDLQVTDGASLEFTNLGIQSPSRGYPYIGELTVRVVRGRNLVEMDSGGTSDPYAKVSFGGNDLVSKTVQKDINPTWDFEAKFKVVSAMQVVRLSVWDSDFGKYDDFMGECILPMLDEVYKKTLQITLPLRNAKHGEVDLEIVYEPNE